MSENYIILLVLLSPIAFIATAIASWFQPGFKPKLIKTMSLTTAIMSILIAAIGGLFVFKYGLIESKLLGVYDIGLSIRLDSLSVLMLNMIVLLSFIIIKFSSNYLDGDQRQGAFIGRLATTIASVQLLVLSGNLGLLLISWVLTSISLHRLLVFYHERPGARIAAKKKFILARMGDACLLASIALMYYQYGTGNIEVIFNAIKTGAYSHSFWAVEGPALFLALAAIFKSAQFPTHGWLIEVMETPTPVSALLHAGLLNAGPFLIIRMATLMEASTVAPVFLMAIGGLTALFGSVVYLTQTSVKTALGYSSIAHMGFSLMASGLGVYSAAMLHLVAHSFYKAHAFLSSGSAIDMVRGAKIVGLRKSTSPLKIVMGILMGVTIYVAFASLWGLDPEKDLSLLILGAVIVMGLSRIFITSFGSGSTKLIIQAALMGLIVITAFFTLEASMKYLLSAQLPTLATPGIGKTVVAGVLLTIFALAVLLQIMAPNITRKPSYQALAIHVRNGFYANTLFDKLIGALHIR